MGRAFLSMIFLATTGAYAGENPPADFMDREVGVLRQYGATSGYGFSLHQFANAMKDTSGKQEWKKENSKRWIYVITIDDAATATKQRMSLVFQQDGKFASVVRFVDNDKEVTPQFVGTAADQIMIPIAQKLGSKSGSTNNANDLPSAKFLELKISTSDDGGSSTVHKYTVKNLVDYYQSQGATVSWSKNEDGVAVLTTRKNGKTTKFGLYEENGTASGYPADGSDERLQKAISEMTKKPSK